MDRWDTEVLVMSHLGKALCEGIEFAVGIEKQRGIITDIEL